MNNWAICSNGEYLACSVGGVVIKTKTNFDVSLLKFLFKNPTGNTKCQISYMNLKLMKYVRRKI